MTGENLYVVRWFSGSAFSSPSSEQRERNWNLRAVARTGEAFCLFGKASFCIRSLKSGSANCQYLVVGGIWKVESPDSDLHHIRRCEESLIHMTHCSTGETNLGRSEASAGGSSGADSSIGDSKVSDWEWGSSRRNHRTSLTGVL